MFLCKLYNITNVLEVFGYTVPYEEKFELTGFEKKLVAHYREKPEMHKAVNLLLGLESSN